MVKRKKDKAVKTAQRPSFTPLDSATATALRNVGSKRDIGDFALKASTLYLTDSEAARLETMRAIFRTYQARSEKRALARAFRILDLPPEIRVHIYQFILLGEQKRESERDNRGMNIHPPPPVRLLADAIPPNVARTCGTFRRECLPLFFGSIVFEIPILANLMHRAAYRIDGTPVNLANKDRHLKRSGVLNLKRPVKNAIHHAGNDAIFKTVKFRVHEAEDWTFKQALRRRQWYLYFVCYISVLRGRLHISVTKGAEHPDLRRDHGIRRASRVEVQDVDYILDQIRVIAAEIEAKEDCKGLTLKDLERMAKVCRFQEPVNESFQTVEDSDDQDEEENTG